MLFNKTLYIYLLVALIFPEKLVAMTKLPILATKQSIYNLRFISQDGKVTYYQRHSGSLIRSTNYKAEEVIKGKELTNYLMYASSSRKKMLITQDNNYHDFYGTRHLKKIFSVPFGRKETTLIGEGISPQLHLNDQWVSFYNPFSKKIFFKNLERIEFKFEIVLKNILNPYFIPQIAMVSDDITLFTDLNDDGMQGLLQINRNDKKITPLLKMPSVNKRIELCINDQSIYIGVFDYVQSTHEKGSYILQLERPKLDIEKAKKIYSSSTYDIGHIICNLNGEKIYFIKSLESSGEKTKSEVVELKLSTDSKKDEGEIKIVSDLDDVSQLLNLDGKLLVPHNGKMYMIYGENNLLLDQLDSKGENSGEK